MAFGFPLKPQTQGALKNIPKWVCVKGESPHTNPKKAALKQTHPNKNTPVLSATLPNCALVYIMAFSWPLLCKSKGPVGVSREALLVVGPCLRFIAGLHLETQVALKSQS